MAYKIESELVLIPEPKYPFRSMEVGESFAVLSDRERNRALTAANSYCDSKHGRGKKFRSRRDGEVIRVWRVL